MTNQKEALVKKQTPREIESRFSDPSRQAQERQIMNDAGRKIQELFLNGDANVEIKKDSSGQKYAIVKHEGKIVYSTKTPGEIANFEEFMKDQEAYLRKQQLKETEEDLLRQVENEILKS